MKKTIQTRIPMYEKNSLIYWSGGKPITVPREHGGTVPFPRAPQLWQGGELPPLQLLANQSFFWAVIGDWIANPLVIGWPHSPWATAAPNTNIEMYEKNTHININTHTNIWKKHAYKWMTKTRIQMYDKNTHTKSHTNVWKKFTHILERWAANYSAQGAWGYSAFP